MLDWSKSGLELIEELVRLIEARANEWTPYPPDCFLTETQYDRLRREVIETTKRNAKQGIMQRKRMCYVCMREDSPYAVSCEFGATGDLLCEEHRDVNYWLIRSERQNMRSPPG
jgi:hypothetical protein